MVHLVFMGLVSGFLRELSYIHSYMYTGVWYKYGMMYNCMGMKTKTQVK